MDIPYQAVIPAPFGALGLRVEHGELVGVDFLAPHVALQAPADDATQAICDSLSGYLDDASAPLLDVPVRALGTVFQQRVWQTLRNIPAGATLTYAELAVRVGSGARAVANACGANPVPLVIPCHRVVARDGIGGFMQGRKADSLSIKQWLLQHERRNPAVAR